MYIGFVAYYLVKNVMILFNLHTMYLPILYL